jgi:hypothetical protein
MTASMRVALGLLLVLAFARGAAASPDNDLSGLSNREYEDYARDRFEWLTGEARSGHRLESKAKHDCKPAAATNSDDGRACEMLKAASEQTDRILQEGRDLLTGLQQRLGSVPPWARVANGLLVAAAGRTPTTAQAAPTGAAPAIAPASVPQPR